MGASGACHRAQPHDLGRKVTTQELLAEALNDLFKKYGKPEAGALTCKPVDQLAP